MLATMAFPLSEYKMSATGGQQTVFEPRSRTDLEPRRAGEQVFAFLDRSGDPEAENARALIKGLYANYPDPHSNLLGRLRCSNGCWHSGIVTRVSMAQGI